MSHLVELKCSKVGAKGVFVLKLTCGDFEAILPVSTADFWTRAGCLKTQKEAGL